jgi:hypothetical protein
MAADAGHIEVLPPGDEPGRWEPVVGDVTTQLREYFREMRPPITREGADRIITEAHHVLRRCNSPRSNAPRRIGLVCGYVQSGKTASMTALAALARDNGFRIIILLAGVTTNLVTQNRDRMETQLREAAPEWTWLMVENPRLPNGLPPIEGLVQEWRSEQYDEHDRRTLFITVMKNHRHLANLAALLSRVDLRGIPTIIFDDEADQASLNTRPNDPLASTTYRNIEGLRDTVPNHSYLQYTATPQAPLLITRIDSLSADFAELVSPGDGYTGGQEFFRGPLPLVETIPPADIFPDGQLPIEPPASLIRAMQVFFTGVAAGRLGPMRSHRSMLLHPSRATDTQRRYYDWANRLKDFWHRVLLDRNEPDRLELMEDFRRAHTDLARTVDDLPPFDQLLARLPVAINQTAITLVNSVDGHEVPWQNGYSHILVGGEKLGRGYTVKGLTVTCMPRSPGGWTADTIQQRARFFGYHREYLGYCRVYLHQDVRAAYVSYVAHETDMRARLAEHSGRPLQEWRRMFYLDERLAPTRRNILASPWMRASLDRDGWFAPKGPQTSPEDGRHNARLLSRLDGLDFTPDERYPRHAYAVMDLRDLYEQVLVPLSYLHENDALGLCVVNCNIKTLIENDNNARCLVYRMDGGQPPRVRQLSNGLIPQVFQGRSSAGAASYPGDRAFVDQAMTTVQLHNLHLKEGANHIGDFLIVAIRLGRHQALLVHDDP